MVYFVRDHKWWFLAGLLVLVIGWGAFHMTHSTPAGYQGSNVTTLNNAKTSYDKADASQKAQKAQDVIAARQNAENNKNN